MHTNIGQKKSFSRGTISACFTLVLTLHCNHMQNEKFLLNFFKCPILLPYEVVIKLKKKNSHVNYHIPTGWIILEGILGQLLVVWVETAYPLTANFSLT
jgi:hypothetical protein